MEAIIRTSDKRTFQKIMEYLKLLGVSVYTKKEEQVKSKSINRKSLLNKLTTGFHLGGFNREEVYDRD